jgi:hypothetical protein
VPNINDVLAARDKALIAVELSKQALVASHTATDIAAHATQAFTEANDAATAAIAEYATVQALYKGTVDDVAAQVKAFTQTDANKPEDDDNAE